MISVFIACFLSLFLLSILMAVNVILILVKFPLVALIGFNVLYVALIIDGIENSDFTG